MRSLTLEEAPDHRPLRRPQHSSHRPQGDWRPLPRDAAPLCPPCDSIFLYRPLVVSRGPSFCSERAKAEADEKEEVCAVQLERAPSPGQRREEDGKPGEWFLLLSFISCYIGTF